MKNHQFNIQIEWTGNLGVGTKDYTSYARDHLWNVKGKEHSISASSDVSYRGNKQRYNPEELFIGSLASCHMLWYLHLCAEAGILVTSYTDGAKGEMEINSNGSGQFKSISLHPRVEICEAKNKKKAEKLHHQAHKMCFIARSINFKVEIIPQVKAL